MRSRIGKGILLALLLVCACGGSVGDKDGVGEGDVHLVPKDQRQPPPEEVTDTKDTGARPADLEEEPDVQVTPTGCGDGICQPSEDIASCAKDCLIGEMTAAFVFAHKGDELASLGRMFDLAQAGADIYVFYVTFDDTPLDTIYSGETSKLSPASVGVAPQNIYAYEKVIEWGIVTGSHEVLDRLTQHFATIKPVQLYLPQLCGGHLEDELTHAAAYWAAKRAKIEPELLESPVPSNYFVMDDPPGELASTSPDQFVEKFIKRWKLIPKGGEELKPTLGTEDMAQIRLAAAHIQNQWFQDFLYKLPEDRLLYLLREIQRFRKLPPDQKPDAKPFLESMDNPAGVYIYTQQGYTFDEFKQMERVIESFFGANVRSDPPALPAFDEPLSLMIMQKFDVSLQLKAFSPEEDTFSFKIGFGPAKDPTLDCETPADVQVAAVQTVTVTVHCKAEEPIGSHTYYFRAYSQKAEENNDAAKYTELPVVVSIGQ